MKKIFGLLTLLTLVFTACEGDPGPPGPAGPAGPETLATVFEETANFEYDAENNIWLSEIFEYNGTLDGDVFLVYLDLDNGLWTNLPASYFDDQGEFQYVFDHDISTVQVSIIGDSDLSTLSDFYISNVPIRVAIIPSDLISSYETAPDFQTLMGLLEISESDINYLDR